MKCPSPRKLAADIDNFLRFKRSLGYRYKRPEFWLKAFVRFVRQQSASTPLEDLARSWLLAGALSDRSGSALFHARSARLSLTG
jgi:hypothetical protein